jgi:type I restriction enzyme S subunit
MIQLPFPTRKLGEDIVRVNKKFKDVDEVINTTVLGVTNTEGITVTGNKASADLSKYIVIKGNQFAYNPYRVNVGSIGLTADNQEGLVSPAYIVFKTKETLIPEFLLYYLKSSIGIKLIRWYGNRGGVRDALRFEDLCKIDIPDLTVTQQLAALRKIKIFEEKINFLNTEFDKQEALLKKYKNSILSDAIQGKLVPQDPNDEPANVLLEKIKEEKEKLIQEKKIRKEKPLPQITDEEKLFQLPKGWEWVRLGDITNFLGGFAFKSSTYVDESDNQIIRLGNVKNNRLLLESNPVFISDELALKSKKYKLELGDILVTMTGTRGKRDYFYTLLINKHHLENRNLFLNQRVGCLKVNPKIYPPLVNLFLKAPPLLDEIFKNETGTANQGNIGADAIKKLIFPLPPLNEQKRIVEKLNELMALCDELEKNIEQSKLESEKLMRAVLQEAFSVKEEVLN